MKKALVIGATGLVGSNLVQQLLQDDRFSTVTIFVRRATGMKHQKLEEHIINFDEVESWQLLVTGDVLFSALGTTIGKAGSKEAQYKIDFTYQYNFAIGKAGSKEAQYKIDFTYQYNFAIAAAQNGVPAYVLVSSAGADPSSRIFYSRMKGELEASVKKLPFAQLHIIQPGLLTGDRQEFRLGEKLAAPILSVLQYIPGLKKYRPIHAQTVAKAMIAAAFETDRKVRTHTLDGVFKLAGEK